MATDNTKELLNGEKVLCSSCNSGYLLPLGTDNPREAGAFQCSHCKKILWLYYRAEQALENQGE